MKECEGLGQEVYDLYALDLLESPLSQLVKAHLESDCPDCLQHFGQALHLWTGIAVSGAQASGERANPALKRRIMKSIEPVRPSWMEWFLMRETWAAAAMMIVLVGATGWFYGQSGSAGHVIPVQTAQIQVQPQPAPAVVPLPAPVSSSPAVKPAGPTSIYVEDRTKLEAVERQLAAALAAASQSDTALKSEMENSARLAAELTRQKATLDAALQPRPQTNDSGAVQRVQFLEEENLRLRRDLTVLRQRAEQGLQLANFLGSPGTRLVKLKGTEAAGRASAQVLVSDGGTILMFASGLPALPAGREYQLWMIRGSGPAVVSAGVFSAAERRAEFQVADATLLNSITTLAVTDEPAGGSPKPTGHKVLIGSAKS